MLLNRRDTIFVISLSMENISLSIHLNYWYRKHCGFIRVIIVRQFSRINYVILKIWFLFFFPPPLPPPPFLFLLLFLSAIVVNLCLFDEAAGVIAVSFVSAWTIITGEKCLVFSDFLYYFTATFFFFFVFLMHLFLLLPLFNVDRKKISFTVIYLDKFILGVD